jgi:hypothetical protein
MTLCMPDVIAGYLYSRNGFMKCGSQANTTCNDRTQVK